MAFDRFFGFDLIQRQTLVKLFAQVGIILDDADETVDNLQQQITDLEARVTALETP